MIKKTWDRQTDGTRLKRQCFLAVQTQPLKQVSKCQLMYEQVSNTILQIRKHGLREVVP